MPLKQPTTTDLARAAIDAAEDTAIRAVASALSALNGTHAVTWATPPDILLALLNDIGVARTLAKFQEHYLAGTALNAIADRAGLTGPRAIVAAARPLRIQVGDALLTPEQWVAAGMPDGTVAFEPQPEPAPEPPAEP